jgi:hypothetical protein
MTSRVIERRMISLACASARARMSSESASPWARCRAASASPLARAMLLGLGANLPHAVLGLDGVLRGLHGAVDGPHHVFGQPQRGVERELVDDEAVGLELLANLTLRRGVEQARLARAVDLLHGHLRRGLIDGLAHDVAYVPVREDVEVGADGSAP